MDVIDVGIYVGGTLIGLAYIGVSLKGMRKNVVGGESPVFGTRSDEVKVLTDMNPVDAKPKLCILCKERPAQEGLDVCGLCEQEDVGTAMIFDMPPEEVP